MIDTQKLQISDVTRTRINVLTFGEISNRLFDGYNDLQITAMVSEYVRNKTVVQALTDALNFVDTHQLIVPDFVKNNRIEPLDNVIVGRKSSFTTPYTIRNNVLTFPNIPIRCINDDSTSCEDAVRVSKHEYIPRQTAHN